MYKPLQHSVLNINRFNAHQVPEKRKRHAYIYNFLLFLVNHGYPHEDPASTLIDVRRFFTDYRLRFSIAIDILPVHTSG